ncbi:endo-1,4-beta-xylanase [Chitinophaga niastensis]|uniref:endo-1,4-beta-xylanase n=1 Tax=Chitinophaga niastensis TaxID=536980 RepID=UPI001304B06E|nr:endo-1,4-beta-xylanase [Chitinophaga niastensis]
MLTTFLLFTISFGCKKQSYGNADNFYKDDIPFTDLINGHDWQHFSGATVKPEGILIQALNRGIVPKIRVPGETAIEQEKEPLTKNPPYNLQGPYLKVQGDFLLVATVTPPSEKGALIYFCGQLPDIYDEWKQEGKSIAIGIKNQLLQLIIHDGTSIIPKTAAFIGSLQNVQLAIKRSGNKIEWYVNNIFAGNFEDTYNIFGEGKIYFGAEAEAGSSFLLNALVVKPVNLLSKVEVVDNKICTISALSNTLRSTANLLPRPIHIGTAVAVNPLMTDTLYARTVASQYSMVTPENDMKFQFIHPQPNIYAFAEADAIVDFARQNKIAVHGHTLAWHEAIPQWVSAMENDPAKITAIFRDHIITVTSHYKGKITEWDVVNEPVRDLNMDENAGLRGSSPWFKAMGEEYIDIAFNLVHNIDPAAKLYINEYGVEELDETDPDNKCNVLYRLVKRLQKRHVPIHGIAFQVHEDMGKGKTPVTPDALARTMKKFTDLGLEVRVSEMDVSLHGTETAPLLSRQAAYYKAILAVCMANPKCSGFSTWGFTDRYSSLGWRDNETGKVNYGNGLPFDERSQPKEAYYALLSQLKGSR